jgi:nitrogen fixation NifU-like protein
MDLYAEHILEHSKQPQNKGLLPQASVQHEEINHSCGDAVTLSLFIENDIIQSVGWEGSGCAISQAAMSMLSEMLTNLPVHRAVELRRQDILDMLGVPVGTRRLKCALLSLHVLKNALRKFQSQPPQEWTETVGTSL